MNREWKTVPFGDLSLESAFGPRFSGADYDQEGNIACLRTTDLDDHGRISYDKMPLARLDQSKFENHLLQLDDLVISRSGTCGITAVFEGFPLPVVPGAFLIRFRLKKDANPRFYKYYFNSKNGRKNILSVAAGAVQQNINITNVKNLGVPFPPIEEQDQIVSILSAYDDLIENSLRRIKILEEMAQSLYREWFVHFRFPGHESAQFTDSKLGKIPVGWELTDLAAVCVKDKGIQTGPFGSQLHESDYSDEGVPVVMPKDLIGFRIRTDSIARIPEETADNLFRHRMKLGDIVYGRRGDIGRRAFIMPHQVGWFCGTGCLRIRPEPDAVNGWFLFNFLGQENIASLIASRAQGVTMPNLNTGLLSSVPVTLPPRSIQEQFASLSFPFSQVREALHLKIDILRQTRDLLLPKLLADGANQIMNFFK